MSVPPSRRGAPVRRGGAGAGGLLSTGAAPARSQLSSRLPAAEEDVSGYSWSRQHVVFVG